MMNNMIWNDTSINKYQQTLKKIDQLVIIADSFVSVHTSTTCINLSFF